MVKIARRSVVVNEAQSASARHLTETDGYENFPTSSDANATAFRCTDADCAALFWTGSRWVDSQSLSGFGASKENRPQRGQFC